MKLAIFYHVFTPGLWTRPLGEFAEALGDGVGEVRFGVIGEGAAESVVSSSWRIASNAQPIIVARAERGFEYVTINALREYAQEHDGAVLYAHTKGAGYPSEHNEHWRRSMTDLLVARWRENLATFESGEFDAVGPYWMTGWPEKDSRFFGGNFWMATCEYLRTLPECEPVNRWSAESWVGIGWPRVKSLLDAVPDQRHFGLI